MTVVTSIVTESASVRPRAHRGRLLLAFALVVVLAGGAGLVTWDVRRLAAAHEVIAARVVLVDALVGLAAATGPARELLASSDGRVEDERVRDDLAEALASASATTRVAAATLHELDAAASRVAEARDEVVAAADELTSAVARWELGQARDAYASAAATLDEALESARAALGDSTGRVPDEAVRSALAGVIDGAQTALDAPEPDDVGGLSRRAAELLAAADSLVAPRADLSAAVAAWEAERAAAQAAAGAAARQGAAAAPAARSPRRAGSSAAAGGSSGGSHWEETVTYEQLGICGDEYGNAWEC